MTAVLVDSNVLLDVLTEDATWLSWSAAAIERAADTARLVINPVIYAEASARFTKIEEFDAVLPTDLFERQPPSLWRGFSGGKGVSRLPAARGRAALAASGLLHRSARGVFRIPAAYA